MSGVEVGSLPDTLRRLAEALPHRFTRFDAGYYGSWWAVMQDDEPDGWVSIGDSDLNLSRLEYALREEILSRGWHWALGQDADNQAYASVMPTARHRLPVLADSPAHALALALLQALADA